MPKFKPGDRARLISRPYVSEQGKWHTGHECTILQGPETPHMHIILTTECAEGYKFKCDCGYIAGTVADQLEPITKPGHEQGSWKEIENDTGWKPGKTKILRIEPSEDSPLRKLLD